MFSVNLTSRPFIKLPGSAFPSSADAYECDKCGRDITKHFRPGGSHSWAPMGPERYQCTCGQKYLTGAIEWDHLGDRERKRQLVGMFAFGLLFSALISPVSLITYFFLPEIRCARRSRHGR